MGDKINLDLKTRDIHGKKVAKLRREGITPAVVYGNGIDPTSVMAPSRIVEKVFKEAGKHHPVYLKVDGKAHIAMIKDADVDPVKRTVRHLSFQAVNRNEQVEAEVPIRLTGVGESAAEKNGLIVLQALDSILVKAIPANLPDALEVSIADLAEAGERLTVADITLPENVELVDHSTNQSNDDNDDTQSVTELVVASVYEPSALQAANEAAGGDAEPEDVANVESENGEDTDSTEQNEAASSDHKEVGQA